ncbi:Tfp pilus assembly protein PilX [Saccharothrix ecbatanensis]|uniref:Tfp pilus assembly protein PilX n=1 Tax=Saccharothrix ecbatanensis TaxID=1105145 RepID=A0A7W9M0V6_9PSEU|nr:ATP-binding protein [Saccharothrix ecbatanensis]MBB5803324.1 Tfp pilus assembly protein PilX [Saccharothrix ecbatanensis]
MLKFAGDLRRLRRSAGSPSYRELGSWANYSAAALSEATAGRRLPSLSLTRAFVRACGGDVGDWTARWRHLAVEPEPADDEPPYVGLRSYQVADAERFFGREAILASLLELVAERPFVGVFGASGSGKSSLLRAGLVAAGGRTAVVVAPGADPVTEVAVRVAALLDRSAVDVRAELAADPAVLRGLLRAAGDDVLLVVDQFEEVFTLCAAPDRSWLVEAITHATSATTRVVIGVRADFYEHCGQHPALVAALHRAQLMVGPMTADELRRIVTEPAAQRGATVEAALLARLVADVAGQPGALPLVSHALVETWQRRRGMTLSLSGYTDAGGVTHALARSADELYEALPDGLRTAARRLFLRLSAPGDGTQDTGRRVRRAEVDTPAALLDRLSAARLIILDQDSVELAHEALLSAWPRLAGWLDEDRDALRAHRRLTEAADTWLAHDRDPDTLYRGARLEQARQLLDRLNAREREFVDASVAAERAHDADRRRALRRLRRLVACLVVLVLVSAGTAVLAVTSQREATRLRNHALSQRAADKAAELLHTNPLDAAVLALAGYRVAPTTEAHDALILADAAIGANANRDNDLGHLIRPPGDRVAITLEADAAQLWARDGSGWRRAGRLKPINFPYLVSADENRVVTRQSSGGDIMWDVTDLDAPRPVPLPPLPLVHSLDTHGDVLTAVVDGEAVVWRSGIETRLPGTGVEAAMPLPDGTGAVIVRRHDGDRRDVEVWTLDGTPHRTAVLMNADAPLEPTIGPAGHVAVVNHTTSRLVVLDVTAPATPLIDVILGPEQRLVTFSADGHAIAATGRDRVSLWDLSRGRALLSLQAQGINFTLTRYHPDSGELHAITAPTDTVWRMDTNFDQVLRRACTRPLTVDWPTHFPDITPPRLCP